MMKGLAKYHTADPKPKKMFFQGDTPLATLLSEDIQIYRRSYEE